MPDATKVTTAYVQQEQVPGGWQDNAETTDREIAESRYKAFSATKEERGSSRGQSVS